MAGYAPFVREWVLVLGAFLLKRPRLIVPIARAGLDARRWVKARASGTIPPEVAVAARHREARLFARPSGANRAVHRAERRGLRRLKLDGARDALLYVPSGYRPERPACLALMLHGATSFGLAALALLLPFADATNLIILAPDARRRTWDGVLGGFGPDVAFIDRALEQVFARYAIDPRSIAVGGFSDGASYALSLGLANGDLFTRVIAFSPGFLTHGARVGSPAVFDSHGTTDAILPIACSERVVATLRADGYAVTFVTFDGPHVVPVAIARRAAQAFVESATP